MKNDFLKVRFAGVVGKLPEDHNISRSMAAYELDQALWQTASLLQKNNIRIIGALVKQDEMPVPDQENEELNIQILPTGQTVNIFLPEKCAQIGCRLDRNPFRTVVDAVSSLVEQTPENDRTVILLNRFGKEEATGGGYNHILEMAMDKNIPVIVGVSNNHTGKRGHNLRMAWEAYIDGTTGVCIKSRLDDIAAWCRENRILPDPQPVGQPRTMEISLSR